MDTSYWRTKRQSNIVPPADWGRGRAIGADYREILGGWLIFIFDRPEVAKLRDSSGCDPREKSEAVEEKS